MSSASPTTSNRGALCIGTSPGGLPPPLASRLEGAGCAVEHCTDVYRAMARVRRLRPTVVLVNVDWLAGEAFEFFEIMARAHREVPVYVYGGERSQHKLDRAVRCGARGTASPDSLAEVFVEVPPPAIKEPHQPVAEEESAAGAPEDTAQDCVPENPAPLASTGNVFDAELDRRLLEEAIASEEPGEDGPISGAVMAEDAPGTEQEPAAMPDSPRFGSDLPADETGAREEVEAEGSGIRVPWRSYSEGPQRIPPQRVADAPPPDDPEDDLDPPLLTPEELAALLGDEPVSQSG